MRAGSFIEGFICGGLLGATMALLFAPSSGDNLRGQIQAELDKLKGEISQAASERRIELEQQLADLRVSHPSGLN